MSRQVGRYTPSTSMWVEIADLLAESLCDEQVGAYSRAVQLIHRLVDLADLLAYVMRSVKPGHKIPWPVLRYWFIK